MNTTLEDHLESVTASILGGTLPAAVCFSFHKGAVPWGPLA